MFDDLYWHCANLGWTTVNICCSIITETPPIGLFMYNHEQVKDLINQRQNDEQWTETFVLEEADRVERQEPAPSPEKSTAKKPDKRSKKGDKTQKEDSMYIFNKEGGILEGVQEGLLGEYWRVQILGIVSGNPYRDQFKEDELPSDSLISAGW